MAVHDEIDALLLDVGDVIVRLNVGRPAQALAASAGTTPEALLHALYGDPCLRSFHEGALSPRQWHEHLQERHGVRLPFDEFCLTWSSAVERTPLLDRDFFAALAPHLRLAVLSNTDLLHKAEIESRLNALSVFQVRVYSCDVGLCKPAVALFDRAVAALGVPAARTLYVDDIPDYVEAGRRAGLQAFHYTSPSALREHLQHRGLWQLAHAQSAAADDTAAGEPRALFEATERVWRDVLELPEVRRDDNFFDLGGHSVRAMQVAARLQDIFECEIPVPTIFERPTVTQLVVEIAEICGGTHVAEGRASRWLGASV